MNAKVIDKEKERIEIEKMMKGISSISEDIEKLKIFYGRTKYIVVKNPSDLAYVPQTTELDFEMAKKEMELLYQTIKAKASAL